MGHAKLHCEARITITTIASRYESLLILPGSFPGLDPWIHAEIGEEIEFLGAKAVPLGSAAVDDLELKFRCARDFGRTEFAIEPGVAEIRFKISRDHVAHFTDNVIGDARIGDILWRQAKQPLTEERDSSRRQAQMHKPCGFAHKGHFTEDMLIFERSQFFLRQRLQFYSKHGLEGVVDGAYERIAHGQQQRETHADALERVLDGGGAIIGLAGGARVGGAEQPLGEVVVLRHDLGEILHVGTAFGDHRGESLNAFRNGLESELFGHILGENS